MHSINMFVAIAIIASSLTIACRASAQSAGSEPLTAQDQEALQETQKLMTNKAQRDAFTATNPAGKAADANVQNLLGPNTDQAYGLASEIFADMVKEAHGDPKKLQQMVEEAQRNPAAFAAKWSPAQKAKLKGMANEVEQRNGQALPPH